MRVLLPSNERESKRVGEESERREEEERDIERVRSRGRRGLSRMEERERDLTKRGNMRPRARKKVSDSNVWLNGREGRAFGGMGLDGRAGGGWA